jgi:hypothetical protein
MNDVVRVFEGGNGFGPQQSMRVRNDSDDVAGSQVFFLVDLLRRRCPSRRQPIQNPVQFGVRHGVIQAGVRALRLQLLQCASKMS